MTTPFAGSVVPRLGAAREPPSLGSVRQQVNTADRCGTRFQSRNTACSQTFTLLQHRLNTWLSATSVPRRALARSQQVHLRGPAMYELIRLNETFPLTRLTQLEGLVRPVKFPRLRYLDLRGNDIEEFSGLASLQRLKVGYTLTVLLRLNRCNNNSMV